jgi:hypothetical protein
MIDIEISDEELEALGRARWLKKQNKKFYQFWGVAVIVFILISIIIYRFPHLSDWITVVLSFLFVFTGWRIYDRILGKPARLAGIKFRKEYKQQTALIPRIE